MIEVAEAAGINQTTIERDKERLKLKHSRTIKLYKDGYLTDEEFQGEIAAIELAIRELESPDMNGIKLDEVLAAGERLPGIAALWDVATVEERREMVMLLLEPGGLLYDLELKMIAAITPRLVFLPILRLLEDVEEHKESPGTLVTSGWFQERRRNRRVSAPLSPILYLFQFPSSTLSRKLQKVLSEVDVEPVPEQRRPGPRDIPYGIPENEWQIVLAKVANHESYRTIAKDYKVSRETIRRLVQASKQAS